MASGNHGYILTEKKIILEFIKHFGILDFTQKEIIYLHYIYKHG